MSALPTAEPTALTTAQALAPLANLTDLPKHYDPATLQAPLYALWEQSGVFQPNSQHANNPHFSIVIPPPNVTGTLHMGHALDNTIQDVLIRWQRMTGKYTLWMPGTDHAGIATQSIVERQLKAEGKTRDDLGRDAFLGRVWDWVGQCQGGILNQLQQLGASADWSRKRFTLDEGCSQAVRRAFKTMYDQGLIYQGRAIVNWDPQTQSAISDIEVEYEDIDSVLWKIAYPLSDGSGQLVVATTRPETLFGDVAVAVHPDDDRYKAFIGKTVDIPLTQVDGVPRRIPVIADTAVDPEFGTGSLKITPAHSLEDFQIGQRHGLEPLLVLDEQACLLPLDFIPAELHGVERFAAREKTGALLDAAGALVSKVNYASRIGKAQRSGAVVEPLLSKQWFVKTRPLADTCLQALEKGEIRFVPERWEKDYVRWLTDIQDWCISRQLWWGHRIPVWHNKHTGEQICSETDLFADPAYSPEDWEQDPDVLDTWFSSGLWPFSTMGWPDTQAKDFQSFYPTSVLVTGFDIIFFWVARMTMMGHQLTGQSPFHTVFIHGLIRDEKGQKMSKSKGNTVDPLESIAQYGTDGFRFGLMSLMTYGGQDIKLSPDKLEQGKLFTNKLWNAARFMLMNLAGDSPLPADAPVPAVDALTLLDQWILTRYADTVREAHHLMAAYKLGELSRMVYSFVWDDLCDWYVEWAKAGLRSPAQRVATQQVLHTVLTGTLQLLHPMMPFVTEALWQAIPEALRPSPLLANSAVVSPETLPTWVKDAQLSPTDVSQVSTLLDLVRAVRNVRQVNGVPFATPTAVQLEPASSGEQVFLSRADVQAVLGHFVTVAELTVLAPNATDSTQEGWIPAVAGTLKAWVSLAGLVDPAKERERLTKQLDVIVAEQTKLQGMMDNPSFVARAPEAVVAKKRERLAELAQQLATVQAQLA